MKNYPTHIYTGFSPQNVLQYILSPSNQLYMKQQAETTLAKIMHSPVI